MNSSKLEKGMLVVVAGQGVPPLLEFQYNPEQYSVEKSAEWNRPQAVGAESTPAPQYVSTNPMSVSMDIFFDEVGSSSGDVTVDVATLLLWTRPNPSVARDRPTAAAGAPLSMGHEHGAG